MSVPNRREGIPFLYWSHNRLNVPHLNLRTVAFFAVLLGLIGLAGWLYLRQVSDVAAYAHEIRLLERQKEQLRREITALRAEVALSGSLARVREEGRKLGYALPETTDASRMARVEYPAPPSPPQATDAARTDDGGSSPTAQGLLPTLLAQLRAWIASPAEESPGR
jgi:cell division protein FtsB